MAPTIFPLSISSPAPRPSVTAVTYRVAPQAGEQCRVRRLEAELLGVTVEPGRRRQMGQAGTEDTGGAQRDDRQHHAQERRAQRNTGPTRSALQGVADADHPVGGAPEGDQVPPTATTTPRAAAHRAPQSRPDAERQDDHHGGQRSEKEDERVGT